MYYGTCLRLITMRILKNNTWLLILASFFFCHGVSAQVVINEIMYDVPGTDTGREWIEITNASGAAVTVSTSTWKFFEANTNHSLTLFQGDVIIPAGGFAVIVDDSTKFIVDWPGFSGTIFESAFSLSNTGEVISIKTSTTTTADSVTYASSVGATGDGNSLQLVSGVWKALMPTPGAANANTAVASSSSSSSATTTSSGDADEDSSTSNNSSWPVEPQIFSRIIGPMTAISGADILLRGEAIGIEKEPLANARYLWNFGDGSTKEGESVLHGYNFSGEYVVILDASGGRYSATSRLSIKIIPADLSIDAIVHGSEGKMDLVNNSNQELDLSWWRIRSGNQFFTLPKNTKILANSRLPLSALVTGLSINNNQDVALLYPNGSVAYAVADHVKVVEAPKISEVSVEPMEASPAVIYPGVSDSRSFLQTASVAEAAVNGEDGGLADQENQSSFLSPWLYGVVGIIILGLGFTFLPKPAAPAIPKNSADDFKIIED